MGKSLLILLWSCYIIPPIAAAAEEIRYEHRIAVDTIVFEWTVDGRDLNVRLSAETRGWVGIGFNPTSKMKDAGFVLGCIKDGVVEVSDEFGESKREHKQDTDIGGAKNISKVSGREEKGVTTIGFTIPMDSGDDKDPVISEAGWSEILLAYATESDSFEVKHHFKISLQVKLETGEFE